MARKQGCLVIKSAIIAFLFGTLSGLNAIFAQSLDYPVSLLQGEQFLGKPEGHLLPASPEPENQAVISPRKLPPGKLKPKPLVRNTGPIVVVSHESRTLGQMSHENQVAQNETDQYLGTILQVAAVVPNDSSRSRPVFDSNPSPARSSTPTANPPAAKRTIAQDGSRSITSPAALPQSATLRESPNRNQGSIQSQGQAQSSSRIQNQDQNPSPNDQDEPAAASSPKNEQKTLRPIPEDENGDETSHDHSESATHFQSAMFLGVSPGKSTLDEVAQKLGAPLKVSRIDGGVAHFYSIDEVNHIEIVFRNDLVDSIDVCFSEPYPVDQVREILAAELQNRKPVSIADESGDIKGLLFPEKGVTLVYSPSEESGIASNMVEKIRILPIAAESFVIRAKGYLEEAPSESKRDLKHALALSAEFPEVHWLLAQIAIAEGDGYSALEACEKAISQNPNSPQYHITLTKALMLLNRNEEAKMYLEEVLPLCENYQHQKALALTLLGDTYRTAPNVDCEKAYEYHKTALDLALRLQNHDNPSIQTLAREVVLNAQLGIILDIARGNWENKESAIEKWFLNTKDLLKDPVVTTKKRLLRDEAFRIARCGLAAQVMISDAANLEQKVQEMLLASEELRNVADDPIIQRETQWETGTALFEAVQSFQRRKQYVAALKYGESTVDFMEQGIEGRTGEADYYALARLYFRLGAIHAIGLKNHKAAIVWFDRTKPVFKDILRNIGPEESGRIGEMLVSMGVSYWETDQKEEAIRLSELGLAKIKAAVDRKHLESISLLIPYSNLATMYEKLDDSEKAAQYTRLAARVKESLAAGDASQPR